MTDNDKALVERLRSGRWLGETTCGPAADRIETLNAMLAAAEECLGDQLAARKEQADRIEAQAAEIERLRGIVAVWLDLAIGPDEMGDYYRQKQVIKASQEALGETE